MLGACLNYPPDSECTYPTLSSPPYTTSGERAVTHPHSHQVRYPAPTLLSGRTTVQTVSWNAPSDATAAPLDFNEGDDTVRTSGTLLLPEAAELRRRFELTQREAEVALLLAQRRTNKEIARMLNVTAHTAKRHAESVLRKLRVNSRFRVLWAITSAARTRMVRSPSVRA